MLMTRQMAMERHGFNHKQLAKALGVKESTLYTYKTLSDKQIAKLEKKPKTKTAKKATTKRPASGQAFPRPPQFQEILPATMKGKTIIIITDDAETIANIIHGA